MKQGYTYEENFSMLLNNFDSPKIRKRKCLRENRQS